MAEEQERKDALYEQLARVTKALASPKRLQLLELLANGPRRVDALAQSAGMTVANTSAHLQALRAAGLVAGRKQGTQVVYRLAGDDVLPTLRALEALGMRHLAEVERAAAAYLGDGQETEPVTRDELARRLATGEVLVLDVRPAEEYTAGHITGAQSIPIDQLGDRLAELPGDREIVAYCRGPYCVYAPAAVRLLRRSGFAATYLQDGFPDWRLANLPVTVPAG